jgi:hypothetical protein
LIEEELQGRKNEIINIDESLVYNRSEKNQLIDENEKFRMRIVELEN